MDQFVKVLDTSPDWISLSQNFGTINPGASEEMEVHLDAYGLFGATYNADVFFISNDPIEPLLNLPIILEVEGIPILSVGSSEYDSTSISYNFGWESFHNFSVPSNSSDDGTLELNFAGDYDSSNEFAEIYIDGNHFAHFNPTAYIQSISIDIDYSELQGFTEDGIVNILDVIALINTILD